MWYTSVRFLCVKQRDRTRTHERTHTHTHLHTWIHVRRRYFLQLKTSLNNANGDFLIIIDYLLVKLLDCVPKLVYIFSLSLSPSCKPSYLVFSLVLLNFLNLFARCHVHRFKDENKVPPAFSVVLWL